jgi:DNA mismatch repair ATPase MutS
MALKGFEDITHELSPFEREKVVPMLHGVLSNHKGKASAIKNEVLREMIFERFGKKIHEPRIRKIAEYMRQSQMLECLVAGRHGYFVATTPEEVDEWLDVMKQRRNALTASIAAGERSKRKLTGYKQPNQFKQRKADPNIIQNFIFQ